jgi:hypothetical protein
MNLDDNLRTELRAAYVPYDGFTADSMIDRAVSAPGRRPMRLGAPIATAAAVLAIAGGTAFALAGGGHNGGTPAASGPSHPVAYTTPTNAASTNAALPADLQSRIEQCIQSQGSTSWTSSNDCANVESICEVAQALDESPCALIPKAVVCDAPSFAVATGGPVAEIPADKTQLCGGPSADVPTKSVAPTH